jgi:membrane-bound metal-dependent hydrolase YbcI (DUF457 family)
MKRAEKNHWGIVALLVFVGNVVPPILWFKTESAIAGGATLFIAVALFFAARRLTISKKWWVLPLLGSPLVLGPLMLGILLVLAIMGVVPVP